MEVSTLPDQRGVVIKRVVPGGNAESIGVFAGDIIREANGWAITRISGDSDDRSMTNRIDLFIKF